MVIKGQGHIVPYELKMSVFPTKEINLDFSLKIWVQNLVWSLSRSDTHSLTSLTHTYNEQGSVIEVDCTSEDALRKKIRIVEAFIKNRNKLHVTLTYPYICYEKM